MPSHTLGRPAEILLVEDNAGDVELTREGFAAAKVSNNLYVASNGIEAMAFLHREGPYAQMPQPDLILLDLNLPKKDGREVLAEIKQDENLRVIPLVVLTTSKADEDILRSYKLNANSYITKPINFDGFTQIVQAIDSFWFTVVVLPPRVGT
jgi:two-component system, chemotaxis family, response regulator Rcp1